MSAWAFVLVRRQGLEPADLPSTLIGVSWQLSKSLVTCGFAGSNFSAVVGVVRRRSLIKARKQVRGFGHATNLANVRPAAPEGCGQAKPLILVLTVSNSRWCRRSGRSHRRIGCLYGEQTRFGTQTSLLMATFSVALASSWDYALVAG